MKLYIRSTSLSLESWYMRSGQRQRSLSKIKQGIFAEPMKKACCGLYCLLELHLQEQQSRLQLLHACIVFQKSGLDKSGLFTFCKIYHTVDPIVLHVQCDSLPITDCYRLTVSQRMSMLSLLTSLQHHFYNKCTLHLDLFVVYKTVFEVHSDMH